MTNTNGDGSNRPEAIEKSAPESEPATAQRSFEAWKRDFDAWMAAVEARAGRYPRGFVMDDSRESIYDGCGE